MRLFRLAQIFESKYKIVLGDDSSETEDYLQKSKSLLLSRVKVLPDKFYGANFEGKRKQGTSPADLLSYKLDKNSYLIQNERIAKGLVIQNNSLKKQQPKRDDDIKREIDLIIKKRNDDLSDALDGKQFLTKLDTKIISYYKMSDKFNIARIRDGAIDIVNFMNQNSEITGKSRSFRGIDKLIQISEPPSGARHNIKEKEMSHIQNQLVDIFNLLLNILREVKDIAEELEKKGIKLEDPIFELEVSLNRADATTGNTLTGHQKAKFVREYGHLYDINDERELDRIEKRFKPDELNTFNLILRQAFETLERVPNIRDKKFYNKSLTEMLNLARSRLKLIPTNEPELQKAPEEVDFGWRDPAFEKQISTPEDIVRPHKPSSEEAESVIEKERAKTRKDLEEQVQRLRMLTQREPTPKQKEVNVEEELMKEWQANQAKRLTEKK
jgi:hypothetical protein